MLRACIDIGSNTTRLLVAECDGDRLVEVHTERLFTRLGRALWENGVIGPEKIEEVVRGVVEQLRSARELGVAEVLGVATASIRDAANGPALISAISRTCGLGVHVLSEEQEAELAFIGAARTLTFEPDGEIAVVDVGGGSSEIALGTVPDRVRYTVSFGVGSGALAERCLRSDPPTPAQLDEARGVVAEAIAGTSLPQPVAAIAVGGSAASLPRLAGPMLDGEAFARAFAVLTSASTRAVAERLGLDRERVRLLPAGLVILEAMSGLVEMPLLIGAGGVREGVLLRASRTA